MNISAAKIKDVLIIGPDVYKDGRGFFMETYNRQRYDNCGISKTFVQDNFSFSAQGTLRGLHFQISKPQAKLVQIISGKIFDVAVDIRPDSAAFGKWVGITLSDENISQIYIPEGFAHGFCVLSKTARFLYKCSDFYDPADEGGIIWSDPDIAIDWPANNPIISEKDKSFPLLRDITDYPKTNK